MEDLYITIVSGNENCQIKLEAVDILIQFKINYR